jgi:hypothetical protein
VRLHFPVVASPAMGHPHPNCGLCHSTSWQLYTGQLGHHPPRWHVSMAGWFTAWSCLRACPADHEFHSRSDQLAVVLTAVVHAESCGKLSTELNASASHHAFKYTPMVARCDHQKQGKQGPPIWPERQNAPLHSCAIINLLRFTVANQAG